MKFDSFALDPALIESLRAQQITEATQVQAECLPILLDGKDLLAQAKTGSGKTFAFLLPTLNKRLTTQTNGQLQALVLCPTRELAEQVAEECRNLAKTIPNYKALLLCGGTPIAPQLASLKHIPDIIIGTPGRVLDVLGKSKLALASLQTLVLDEADRMLDMGFADQMQQIFDLLNKAKSRPQCMLFSATLDASVEQLVAELFSAPEVVKVATGETHHLIEQTAWQLIEGKMHYAVAALLTESQPAMSIVFCNTKAEVDHLTASLLGNQFDAVSLHGDMTQEARDAAIRCFKSGCANVLVASDVAARGLDIDDVDMVICAQISPDIDTHIHRIGRTGRSGKQGLAMLLFEPTQANHIQKLSDATMQPIPRKHMQALRFHANRIVKAIYKGITISAGKKQKINKVDIVGLLTQQGGIPADDIGKIFVTAQRSFIALKLRSVKPATRCFKGNKIKGKRVLVSVM